MDLAPERLVMPCSPSTDPGVAGSIPCGEARPRADGTFANNYFRADHAAWAKLVSQYAMAIAPSSMHPARTTGYGGFEMSLFGQMTTIASKERYMELGTEGGGSSGKFANRNGSPDGVLSLFGVTGRKGLPYGFELQGTVGYMSNTELVVLGGGIRLAPFEGWRKWFDLSVGGYVHTLTGTSKLKITVPALDIQISRPFTIANMVVAQPYFGWQHLWILADSSVIDTTPNVDGLKNCNARPANPAERGTDSTKGDTGEFHCQQTTGAGVGADAPAGSSESNAKLDLNNNVVFRNLRVKRQRLMFGVSFKYEIAHILLHAMYDIASPSSGADAGDTRLDGLPKQFTFGMMTGVSW